MTLPNAASVASSRCCRDDELFLLHPGYLLPWHADLDQHARGFAEQLQRSGYSPPMIMGCVGGVAELLAAHWHMVEGRSLEDAVVRMREWRKLVLQKHAWELIAAADRAKHTSKSQGKSC